MCRATVASLRDRSAAIMRFVLPAATRRITSISRPPAESMPSGEVLRHLPHRAARQGPGRRARRHRTPAAPSPRRQAPGNIDRSAFERVPIRTECPTSARPSRLAAAIPALDRDVPLQATRLRLHARTPRVAAVRRSLPQSRPADQPRSVPTWHHRHRSSLRRRPGAAGTAWIDPGSRAPPAESPIPPRPCGPEPVATRQVRVGPSDPIRWPGDRPRQRH